VAAPAGRAEPAGGERGDPVAGRLRGELEGLVHELTVRIPGVLGLEQCHREYQAAVARQQAVRRRIRLVGRLLAGLPCADAEALPDDRVGYGSVVFLRDLDTGDEAVLMLVEPDPANPSPGEVAPGSPLGEALLGRRAGGEVVLAGARRDLRFRLLALYTLPRCLGLP
jgi:transcription elongation GreA/GreB family factor